MKFSVTSTIACALLLISGLLVSTSSAQEALEPEATPVPRGEKCPKEYLFSHFNIYYFSVAECLNGPTENYIWGYTEDDVVAGCENENKCNTSYVPIASADNTGMGMAAGGGGNGNDSDKIPAAQIADARKPVVLGPVVVGPGQIITTENKVHVVEVDDNGKKRYFVLVKFVRSDGITVRFSREVDAAVQTDFVADFTNGVPSFKSQNKVFKFPVLQKK